MTFLLCIAVIAVVLYSNVTVVQGGLGQALTIDKKIFLCDNAVKAVARNPGKQGAVECLEKYCIEEDLESPWGEVDNCRYENPYAPGVDCGCDGDPVFTGVTAEGKEIRVCVLTSGYNLPGLAGKIDLYESCGYDLTEAEDCTNGKIEGEITSVRYKVGQLMHNACEHGELLYGDEDYGAFVEVCKFQLNILDYDSDCKTLEELPANPPDKYGSLILEGKLEDEVGSGGCAEPGEVSECADFSYRRDPYLYYLCVSGNGNKDNPRCLSETYVAVEKDEYKIAYVRTEYEGQDRGQLLISGSDEYDSVNYDSSYPAEEEKYCE